jgi:dimethylaniline monooxygenase (N-oxide forming)
LAIFPLLQRTNLPKEAMAFPDFPFDPTKYKTSFVRHGEVRDYLDDYADHYELRRHIQLEKQG